MDPWAEKNGVIIISINDSKNDLDMKIIDEIQADVIKSTDTTLRLHPCLRFSMG